MWRQDRKDNREGHRTIGLDERWDGGWKRGEVGEVVDKINRIIGRGDNYDNYWVMKGIKRPRSEPLWTPQSVRSQ